VTLRTWGCGAADAARLVDADGPASTEPGPKFPVVDACCARKPTRAWISYKSAPIIKDVSRKTGVERAHEGGRAEEFM